MWGGIVELGGFVLETFRYDGLSRIWGLIFIIAAFINGLYGFHERRTGSRMPPA